MSTETSRPVLKTKQKLLPRDWLQIVSAVTSGVSVRELAGIYKVSESVIYKGLSARKVNLNVIAAERAMEANERVRAELVKKIKETKDKDYRFTEFLQQQIVSTIVDAQKAGDKVRTVIDDVKALKLAIDGIRSGTENKFKLLGLDKENDNADAVLPELPIRELTDLETDAMRSTQDIEDGVIDEDEVNRAIEALDEEDDEPDVVEEDDDE